jgi:hypothetical protein
MTMDLLGVTIPKTLTASSFVKSGGDETQYLMADGSTSSFRTGPLKFYHYDWGNMQGGVISHSSQLIFALTSDLPPLQSNMIMSMDVLGVTINKDIELASRFSYRRSYKLFKRPLRTKYLHQDPG